jgi:N-acetylglucosamine-6-phosphate deacetylase
MRFPSFNIINASVVLPDGVYEDCSILCSNGKITQVLFGRPERDASNVEIVDARGNFLAPGFIDLHIHGAKGYLAERGRADLESLSAVLPQYGVTGFLPSIGPANSEEEDLGLLHNLSMACSRGATILGLFLEGHFLALNGAITSLPKYRNIDQLNRLMEACTPYKAIFGISPELDGIFDLLSVMTEPSIPAFLTHTVANCEQTVRAIAAGATHATHFYDVFPYPGEKDPGMRACGAVEAILADPSVSVNFILDGEHVDPMAVRMALVCKGPDKVCLKHFI